jgi:phosphoribosylformimino-5-aminoimidazole carboxamide ribotide isomerase
MIALDSKGGKVFIKGWRKETKLNASDVVRKFEPFVSEVLFTNIDLEGKMEGIDEKVLKKIVRSTSLGVIASGGISSIDDIFKIKKLGAKGVVIGSALYKKKIDFAKAKKIQDA